MIINIVQVIFKQLKCRPACDPAVRLQVSAGPQDLTATVTITVTVTVTTTATVTVAGYSSCYCNHNCCCNQLLLLQPVTVTFTVTATVTGYSNSYHYWLL